ncbi:MAG: 30S ribosomal protein S6 [Candidatus Aenigmarchaeota archaeon]|nr:30S ribosomal protein S6 [Candidatus Aenigmarchaeota archaeon]
MYELLCLLPEDLTEEELKPIIEELKKQITDLEGKIEIEENLGKQKLAYPIKHNSYGYYLLFRFSLDKQSLAKLNKQLKLITKLLRYLITIYIPEKAKKIRRMPLKKEIPLADKEPSLDSLINPEEKTEKKTEKKKVDTKKISKKIEQLLTKI